MPKYIAAIDQGTTSTRCIIYDRSGPVATAQKEHRQIFPQPGWVEHDPLEIWERTQQVIAEAVDIAGTRPGEIAAIGIANQRETIVTWDRTTGLPLYNAIVWQDTRTKEICDALAAEGGQNRFSATTGLPLATYFSGPKLKWIFDNVPEARRAAGENRLAVGTIDSWLIWNLTGGAKGNGAHVIDVTNASRTMLMDLRRLEWDESMLKAFGIPGEVLPKIVPSTSSTGWGRTSVAGPFGDSIPVCGCLGDQHAALVGQTCFSAGESKNTYGTGCFMLLNTGNEPMISRSGLLTTLAYQFEGQPPAYALEGSIAVAGSLVQWLRDNLGLIESSADVEELARTVHDNGGVYFVPAFSGLFAPYWRSDARGVIAGLTGYARKGHLARAVLESTAYQSRDVLEAMEKDSGVKLKVLRVDGGMARNELLMQFQADVLNVSVVRPKQLETTALGAAYAAGLAVGFWKDVDELRANGGVDREWKPSMLSTARENSCAAWRKAVERSFGWVE